MNDWMEGGFGVRFGRQDRGVGVYGVDGLFTFVVGF